MNNIPDSNLKGTSSNFVVQKCTANLISDTKIVYLSVLYPSSKFVHEVLQSSLKRIFFLTQQEIISLTVSRAECVKTQSTIIYEVGIF